MLPVANLDYELKTLGRARRGRQRHPPFLEADGQVSPTEKTYQGRATIAEL